MIDRFKGEDWPMLPHSEPESYPDDWELITKEEPDSKPQEGNPQDYGD